MLKRAVITWFQFDVYCLTLEAEGWIFRFKIEYSFHCLVSIFIDF